LLSNVRTSYNAFYFVTLKPWSDRKTRAEQYQEMKAHLNQQLSKLPQGTVSASRRQQFLESAPPEDFSSCWKIAQGGTFSFWRLT